MICEVDEQWSFVRKKSHKRWLWYAWEPRYRRILAHAFGDRSQHTLDILLTLLTPFSVTFFCTDYYPVYKDKIPQEKHIIGKYYTQRIERMNLTLRTRLKRLNRKTIGFSKSSEMHDKVIGTFIDREFYG